MARKAGPGDGAEDAPEGRADLSSEEGVFVPDARLSEDVAQGPEVRSSGADSAPPEALSQDSSVSRPLDDEYGRVEDAVGQSEASSGSSWSAAPEDWRLAVPPDEEAAPTPWATTAASLNADAGQAERSADDGGADPFGRRDGLAPVGADPVPLAAPVRATEESGGGSSNPPLASPPPRRRGGFGGLLLGGLIAAALGFGAAWLAQDRLDLFPARLPTGLEERFAALEARLAPEGIDLQPIADRLADAESRLRALEEAPVAEPAAGPAATIDLGPLRQEIEQGLSEAQAQATRLEERLAALEARPAAPIGDSAPLGSLAQDPGPAVRPAPPVDSEALREDLLADVEPRLADTEAGLAEVRTALSDARSALDALTARLDGAEAQSAAAVEEARTAAASLAEAQTRAATAEAQAHTRAVLGQVEASLAAGEPFEAPLAELGGTGVPVPETLAQLAAEGAPTLATLRESFPEAARAGLSAAREQGLLDDGSGVLGFLRGQLSVRSVAPREGQDPDAVLSRAQAHLADGRLDAALTEIGALPEPVRAAMADWIAEAGTRAQADAALAGLRDALPALDSPPAD